LPKLAEKVYLASDKTILGLVVKMRDRTSVEGSELEKFIDSTIESIRKALPKEGRILGTIRFELAVVTTKSAEGGLKILVIHAGGKYAKEKLSRITFEIGNQWDSGAWREFTPKE